jgi:uncharacterized protein YtpQ (UPF0354 family)
LSDRDEFVQKLARAISGAGLGETRFDAELYALEYDGGKLYLNNAFAEYQRAGFFSKRAVIRRWVGQVQAMKGQSTPASFEEARANLLPYVRDRNYYGNIALVGRVNGQSFPALFRPLGGELTVGVAHDGPSTIASIAQPQLDQWGVTLEEALRSAQVNMRTRTPDGFAAMGPGLYVSPYRDNYDASRIVLTELISRLDVKGDPVAFAAHRDSLIITGSEDTDGLIEAARMTLQTLEHERRISGSAVCYRGGAWETFSPPEGSPAHEPVSRARMSARAKDYGDQAGLLQKIEGDGVFVASFSVMESPAERWISYGVWGDGVPTWLPVTDAIAFTSSRFGEDKFRMGPWPWADVERVAGALMEKKDVTPERVFVNAFPTDEMIQAITSGQTVLPGVRNPHS